MYKYHTVSNVVLSSIVIGIFIYSQSLTYDSHSLPVEYEPVPEQVLSIENSRPTTVPISSPSPTPLATTHTTWGIIVPDYTNSSVIQSLESRLGSTFTSVSIYKQFGNQFNARIPVSDVRYIGEQGKKLVIAWEPWNPDEGNAQTRDYLSEIPAGSLDSYLTEFASDITTYSYPVTIRFGHEMNGNWYPWGNRPEEYKEAYRHVVDLFRNLGVSNVTWMWCINSENVPNSSIAQVSHYYPGDSYVDVIGLDGYNFGTASGGIWREFDDIFGSSYRYISNSYNKPIVIAEVASSEFGGSKPDWITRMHKALETKYPKIDEIVWFNLLKEADWRIESTDASLASFKASQ